MYVFISFFIVEKVRFYNEIVNLIILKLEESLVIILYVIEFFFSFNVVRLVILL